MKDWFFPEFDCKVCDRGCIGYQGPVVRKIDNAIAFNNDISIPLDSDLSSGYIALSNVWPAGPDDLKHNTQIKRC